MQHVFFLLVYTQKKPAGLGVVPLPEGPHPDQRNSAEGRWNHRVQQAQPLNKRSLSFVIQSSRRLRRRLG
jgi:hypothetical protein